MFKCVNTNSEMQLYELENIFYSCYSTNKKFALIKTNKKSKTIVTNDSSIIINTLQLNDPIVRYTINLINQHSNQYGDNTKLFYFYICEFIRHIKSNKHVYPLFRFISLNDIYEFIQNEFANSITATTCDTKSVYKLKLNEIVEVYLSRFNVFNHLNYSNEVNCVINSLIQELIKIYYKKIIPSSNGLLFNSILNDLNHILLFTIKSNKINDSNLYNNGFLINRKFVLNNLNRQHELIKAIVLVKNSTDTDVDSKVEYKLKLDDFKLNNSQFNSKLSQNLIDYIQLNKINLILTPNSLNEWEKSQLNKVNCSLVSYIDENYMKFLCNKLNLYEIASTAKLNDQESIAIDNYLINIESYEYINNDDSLIFFKLADDRHDNNCCKNPLAFIHFYLPIECMEEQIKTYFIKILKTLKLLEDNENIIIENFMFESLLCSFLDKHTQTNELYKHLKQIIFNLNRKLSKFTSKNELNNSLEPLELKLRCLMGTLKYVKCLINTENIINVNGAIASAAATKVASKSDDSEDND